MEDKLENTIMGKIKTGQVRLRSKYVFIAEKLGLGTAFALSAVLAALLFNLILFYLKETDNLKYLSFGRFGILAFLESFPYLLVVAFIVLIVLSGYLLTRSDVSYKKPFGMIAVGTVVLIMVAGGVLTYTNLGRSLEIQARSGNVPARVFLSPLTEERGSGIAGAVFEITDDYLILQTQQGLKKVELKEGGEYPEISAGEFIIAVGRKEGDAFVAEKIRISDKEDMPAINRGIDFKFGASPEAAPSREKQDCVRQCFDSGKGPDECLSQCNLVEEQP